MALSFKEKRTVQLAIEDGFVKLGEGADFRTKRALQQQIEEGFARLAGTSVKKEQTLLDRLLSGEFLDEAAKKFIQIVGMVVTELNGDYRPIVQPVIDYVGKHTTEINWATEEFITESAALNEFSVQAGDVRRLMALLSSLKPGQKMTISLA